MEIEISKYDLEAEVAELDNLLDTGHKGKRN